MKQFIIGFTAAILVCALAVGALAATGKLTIEVNTDMKIQVNGNVFAPTDVNGNPVPIFEYNGTTYAPLRALAEAYGLEVGYDAASRMATVSEAVPSVEPTLVQVPESFEWSEDEEEAYKQFCAMWEEKSWSAEEQPKDEDTIYIFEYCGNLSSQEFLDKLRSLGEQKLIDFCRRRIDDCIEFNNLSEETLGFDFMGANGGADGGYIYKRRNYADQPEIIERICITFD